MKFDTYLPCELLLPYVKALVISETTEESVYKVLPDTGVVIGFQYEGQLAYELQGKAYKLAPSGITGLNDSFRLFRNSVNIRTVLVFFKEAGAGPFFKQPLHELFRESVSLDNFMLRSELLILEEQLCSAKTDSERITTVEQFLISRMRNMEPDPIVSQAIAVIHQHHGNIRIKELLQQVHISQSPFEKRFRSAVGTSAKKFASIVRMKYALQAYDPRRSLTELGHETGFYDQSHFIKEFKNFTGVAPEDYFKENR